MDYVDDLRLYNFVILTCKFVQANCGEALLMRKKGDKMEAEEKKDILFRPEVLVAGQSEIGKALMDEVHMEGLIMRKCSEQDIYYSNAFMVVTKKASEDPVAKYYKIQNKVFFKALAKTCQNAYFCTKEECKKSDAIVAEFIYGTTNGK